MRAVQAVWIVGVVTFTGIAYQISHPPAVTVPDAKQVSAATPASPALSATVPAVEAPKAPAEAPVAPVGPETVAAAVAGPPVMTPSVTTPLVTTEAEIGDDRNETKSVDTKPVDTKPVDTKLADTASVDLDHHDAAPTMPATRDAPADASRAARATQDFRYLIYYVWSEIPPAEKPAAVVLRSFKDIPLGTPVEEIKRASEAFGLDFNFMKAVAKIESGFDPKQRTGSYIGLFQLSKYEFSKYGSGDILSPRDNAVAAAYKVITEGILFDWVTHRTPDLSDLYLIHQQGWEGAAEHISQPDRTAWRSMCATGEGREKGEKWCKRAIWGNTLPAIKDTWKSVDKLTSGAFIGMWRARVAEFYSKYMTTATAAAERANQ